MNTILAGGTLDVAEDLAGLRSREAPGRSQTSTRSAREEKTPPRDSTGRTCNAIVGVERGEINHALRRLKKMLGTNGTFNAVKRAEQVPRERRTMKKLRARRRAQKQASRARREEARLPDCR